MELFSEIYNCYYQIVADILQQAEHNPLTKAELSEITLKNGYKESVLQLVPKLITGEWKLLEQKDSLYYPLVHGEYSLPLTELQKSWLKAVIEDQRILLFLNNRQQTILKWYLREVNPLFKNDQLNYFDQYTDGDCYTDQNYQKNFRILIQAIKEKEIVELSFLSKNHQRVTHCYFPCKIEYSLKENKFRVLALKYSGSQLSRQDFINIARLDSVRKTGEFVTENIDINKWMESCYSKEPLLLELSEERNTLERAMLHFANYEKRTEKVADGMYRCSIYYHKSIETELLIQVLSFGPTVRVIGPDAFVLLIKERLKLQKKWL